MLAIVDLRHFDFDALVRRDDRRQVELHGQHLFDLVEPQLDDRVGRGQVERHQRAELEREAFFERAHFGLVAGPLGLRGDRAFDVLPRPHRREHDRLAVGDQLLRRIEFAVVGAAAELGEQSSWASSLASSQPWMPGDCTGIGVIIGKALARQFGLPTVATRSEKA